MNDLSKVKANTIYNLIKTSSTILYPLITFPYITRVLMVDNVGKVNFGESIISYISLLASLGISTYAIRECAKTKNDRYALETVASQIFSINLLTTIIAYIVLLVLLIVAKPLADYRLLIVILSINIIFSTLGADWLNMAMEDLKYVTIRTVLSNFIAIVMMLLFVKKPDDYMIYAGITVLSTSMGNISNIFYRRKYCHLFFTTNIDWTKHLPKILLLFSMLISQTIYCNSDITIIGLLCGDYEVGIYSVAVKVYNLVNFIIASIALVVMPQLSFWYTKKDYIEINKILRYAFGFIAILGIPCLVGMNVIAEGIVQIIAGNQYIESVKVIHILSLALACSLIGGFIGNIILIPSGREKICFFVNIVSAILNLALNVFFIPRYGYIVAAVTTVVAEFIGVSIGIFFVEKEVFIERKKALLFPPIIGSMVIFLVAFVMNLLVTEVVLRTCIVIVVSGILYIVVLFILKSEYIVNYIAKMRKHEI